MPVLGELALWLTLVLGVWSIVAARSGPAPDPRLLASGARALHAASALMVIAALAAAMRLRDEAMAATGGAPAGAIVRDLLGAWPTYVIVIAGIIAMAAAMVPRSRGIGPPRHRVRAHVVGGSCVALAAAAALALRSGLMPPGDDAAAAAELHHWGGVVFHFLYPAGIAASLIPVAIGPVPHLTTKRLRWTLYALAAVLTALAAGVWARYAGAAPAPELDAAGVLADRPWTKVQLLLLVPPLLLAAGAHVLDARRREAGVEPARTSAARVLAAAHACALVTLALAVVAMSSDVQPLEMGPGSSATVSAGSTTWKATSQGTSQVDGASYDGAVVAFLLEADGAQHFATAGERLYRDAQGHNAARVAVPAIVRQPAGDLRFTVRGLRGDAALVRARYHPLATPAWVMAAATIVLLLAGAGMLRPAAAEAGPR